MMLKLHKRKPLTKLQRAKLFRDHNGMCCICGLRIGVADAWDIPDFIDEHGRALGLGGTNDMSNRGPAHVSCAKVKTQDDVARIAKAKRQEANFIGAKSPKRKIPSRPFRQGKGNCKQIHEEF